MRTLVEGTATDVTPLEQALLELVKKSVERPRQLQPGDLEPLRDLVGDGALEYVPVLGAFHFINRVADLLGVKHDLPLHGLLRRVEWLRQKLVGGLSRLMRQMTRMHREYRGPVEELVTRLATRLARGEEQPTAQLRALEVRPALLASMCKGYEIVDELERGLGAETLQRVLRLVEQALPDGPQDLGGLPPIPDEPVAALAFIGTRFAHRSTPQRIQALREAGYDDGGILELTVTVSLANQVARQHRLLGLPLPGASPVQQARP